MNKLKQLFAKHPSLTAIILGALYPFGFAPFYWVIPSLLAIGGLYFLWQWQTPKQARLSGFLFAFSAFLVGANWILTSVGTFGGAPMWLAVFLMLGLHSIMGLYFALLGYITVKHLPRLFDSDSFAKLSLTVLTLASLFTLIEWLRGWFLSGFPWLNVGYLSTNNSFAGYAPIGGVYLLTFILVCVALFKVLLLHPEKRIKLMSLSVIVASFFVGKALHHYEWTQPYKQPLSVALIQGGVSQDLKWVPEQLPKTMAIYHDLSVASADADLVVWPEAAIPNMRNQSYEYYKLIKERVGGDTGFVFSSLVRFPNKPSGAEDVRHGFYVLDDKFGMGDEQVYYKQHLVPYGEYFPVPDFIAKWMMANGLLYGDVTPGSSDQLALTWNDYKIGSFICYEDAYPNIVRSMFNEDAEANFLVNVTNDAWFSGSFAPFQHMQITQMRAVEMQRPVLRATNDGVTAIIEYKGNVVNTVPQYQPEVLRGNVQPRVGMTPYAKFGNWPIVGLCLLLLGINYQRRA